MGRHETTCSSHGHCPGAQVQRAPAADQHAGEGAKAAPAALLTPPDMVAAAATVCSSAVPSHGPCRRTPAVQTGEPWHGTGWGVPGGERHRPPLLRRDAAAAGLALPGCPQCVLPGCRNSLRNGPHLPHPLYHAASRPQHRAARTRAAADGSGGSAAPRLVLEPQQRAKLDMRSDADFYSMPRFVHHQDANFRAQLTQLYRERIPEGAAVLDLCSSWWAGAQCCRLPSLLPF